MTLSMQQSSSTAQDALKTAVGQAALAFVPPGSTIGVGTGSTVNRFIAALAGLQGDQRIAAAVSSSAASTALLQAAGIAVLDANAVERMLAVYIDGADEIDGYGCMVKGGGAALTREKIVAAQSHTFVCIADASKQVLRLGKFPIPVEIIPMAARRIARQFADLGGVATLRLTAGGVPLLTDNGQQILDVAGLQLADPLGFETTVSQWPGVVTVGVFAVQKADICLLATPQGVQTLRFTNLPVAAKGKGD